MERPDAPRSTGSPGVAAPIFDARQPIAPPPADSNAGSRSTVPAACRGSGDTRPAAGHARSSVCRTGSTLESRQQPNRQADRDCRVPATNKLSTISTGLYTPYCAVAVLSKPREGIYHRMAVDNSSVTELAVDSPAGSRAKLVARLMIPHPGRKRRRRADFTGGSRRRYDHHRNCWLWLISPEQVERAGRGQLMTIQPSSHWFVGSPASNRSNLLAAVRAGLIALVLLAVLAVIVLS